MKNKKIIYFLIIFITMFYSNIVARADSYCNYNSKKDCEKHNEYVGDKYDYSCEWKKTEGKEYCAVKCSTFNEQTCNDYSDVCRWNLVGSKHVCQYIEEGEIYDIDEQIYNNYDKSKKSCGATKKNKTPLIDNIPSSIPKIIHVVYLTILIAVPVVLVIFGMLDLFKGITAQKEEDARKGQQIFVKRLISAALIFFVFMIIKLFIDLVADSNKSRVINCIECFIENKCNS